MMLESALGYAGRGWRVFPCKAGGKSPATAHGLSDATVDLDQIRRWWGSGSACNIGLATGTGSIDVLDVDVHPDGSGFPALRRVREAGLADRPLAIVETPHGGGLHLWFRGSNQRNGRLAEQHLDFRSAGGYVLVPPSVVDGKSYEFVARDNHARGTVDWSAIKALLTPPRAPSSSLPPGDPARLAAWMASRRGSAQLMLVLGVLPGSRLRS